LKLGIVLSTNEPEIVWNSFRFGNTSLKAKHIVTVFLMNKGVEVDNIKNKKYNIKEQINMFIKNKGKILACGTCPNLRHKKSSICPASTMEELLKIVEESDKILTFG